METRQNLLIRADAGPRMCTGHVMRCLALAQSWQDAGGRPVFFARELPDKIAARLQADGVETIAFPTGDATPDAAQTAQAARDLQAGWAVVDGYAFGAEYQDALKKAGVRVLFLDDYGHGQRYSSDIVLNENPGCNPRLYGERAPGTQLLLGPEYALIRREFMTYKRSPSGSPKGESNVLVTLGGSDPENVTSRIISALAAVSGIRTRVLIGPANPRREQIAAQLGQAMEMVDPGQEIPEVMRWADLAISAAGVTALELCYLGVPALLIILVEHQRGMAEGLDRCRAAVNLGWHNDLGTEQIASRARALLASPEDRAGLSEQAKKLVDGRGATRVVEAMLRAAG